MTTTETTDAVKENHPAPCYPLTGQPAGSAITIQAPTPEAVQAIAEHLCEADRAELTALGHHDHHALITASLKASREAYVACWDGKPQAIFGVADYPADGRFGVPWMLSTGTGGRYAREFMDASHRIIEAWSPMYVGMFNIVSQQHHTAHGWLKVLRFVPLRVHTINRHDFTEYGRLSHV